MNDRTFRRRAAGSWIAVATALLVAGCSGTDDGASSAQTTAASTPGSSTTASTTGSGGNSPTSTTSASDPSATAAPEQALASRDFTVSATYVKSRVRMRLGVVELKRRGDLLDLRATLTNLEQDDSRDLRWQVASRFQGANRRDITTIDGVFSGAILTDVAGKKRYLVAADSGNSCVCTVGLSSTFVGAGQSVELNATYAAPPVSTTKLDVSIASLGTFRDLPVS